MAEERGPFGIFPKGPIRKRLAEKSLHGSTVKTSYAEIFKKVVKYPFVATVEDEFGKVLDWKDTSSLDEAIHWRDAMLAKMPEAEIGFVQEITWRTRPELTRMKR